MNQQVPSIGRMVHYVSRGSADGEYAPECCAAVITGFVAGGPVSLYVITPKGTHHQADIQYGDHNQPGTWHWPERV